MTRWFGWKQFFRRAVPIDGPPWLPSAPDEHSDDELALISPLAAPIHVQSGSAVIRVDNGVLVVVREGEPQFERPIELVSALHIHGWATITSPCIGELIAQGTPVIWRGATGYPIGYATPMSQPGLETRRAQYAAVGSAQGLAIARELVAAKIANMRDLVRRRATLAGRECLGMLQRHAKRAKTATTLEVLLGFEGAATAQYFAAWPTMISARARDLTFDTRTRRPPQDEVSALLSYTYAVLCGECLCACSATGLDPRQGYLHRPRAGRPALALDLMEPFRPLIADQAVLSGLNNGQMKPEHFRTEGHARLLTEDGRRTALEMIERRLASSVKLEGRQQSVTLRETIGLSARSLGESLRLGRPFQLMERA
jgi:CRISP-associated protein Cas1